MPDISGAPPRNAMEARRQQSAQSAANMSPEEKVIMEQCRTESFYYRALPIGLAFGSLTQAGIASGKIVAVGTFGMNFSLKEVQVPCSNGTM